LDFKKRVVKKIVIGIDVSKEKLDFCLQLGEKVVEDTVAENTTRAIISFLKGVLRSRHLEVADLLLCAEYTGQYTWPLGCACTELGVDLWLENPAQIKHSSGVHRGKNDRLDARRIAAYAVRFQDKMRLYTLPERRIASLKQLVSERDMYIVDKGKYQGQLTDQKRFMSKEDYASKKD
jgi:transposase